MANRDLLKEAIADAKAVKETAIANAKAALEEAFNPIMRERLAAKIAEMDERDEAKEEMTEMKEKEIEENYDTTEEAMDTEKMEEAEEIDEMDLDALLKELDELGVEYIVLFDVPMDRTTHDTKIITDERKINEPFGGRILNGNKYVDLWSKGQPIDYKNII